MMRYLAFKLPGLEPLHGDVPLRDVTIGDSKNAPKELSATIDFARAYEDIYVESTGETVDLLRPRGTLLVADDGASQAAFVVDVVEESALDQQTLAVSAVGWSWVGEVPWTGDRYDGVEVDPLSVVRHIWAELSSHDDFLTVEVDDTSSTVTVGEEETEVEFTTGDGEDVAFDAGPFRLNWWSTDDLQKVIDDLASETPFEWDEQVTMDRDSEADPQFRIRLGYPRLNGARRDNLLFELGRNVFEPQQPEEQEFFTEVLVVGNGDGSKKRHSTAKRRDTGRMRTVKVISDQGITSNRQARRVANEEIERAEREARFIETCRVHDTPAAPVGTFGKGDIISIRGETVWGWHQQDCRITATERRMEDNSVSLTLERLDD